MNDRDQVTVFAILGSSTPDELSKIVMATFGDSSCFRLPSNDWLVAARTQQSAHVYELMKENAGDDVSCIVVHMDRFYGWNDAAIWQWIEAKRSGKS